MREPRTFSGVFGDGRFSTAPVRKEGKAMWKKYSYAWITLGLFLFSLAGHWIFGWYAYVDEQQAHHQDIRASSYLVEMMRDTLENWQSEFLQLLWQVGGLAVFLFYGSPLERGR
jgi:hypothetical protein